MLLLGTWAVIRTKLEDEGRPQGARPLDMVLGPWNKGLPSMQPGIICLQSACLAKHGCRFAAAPAVDASTEKLEGNFQRVRHSQKATIQVGPSLRARVHSPDLHRP